MAQTSKQRVHAPPVATFEILALPTEILSEIGLYLPHITSALDIGLELSRSLAVQPSFFVSLDPLRALTHTCRRLRGIYTPLLWTHLQASLLPVGPCTIRGGLYFAGRNKAQVWQLKVPYQRLTSKTSYRNRLCTLLLKDSFIGTYVW